MENSIHNGSIPESYILHEYKQQSQIVITYKVCWELTQDYLLKRVQISWSKSISSSIVFYSDPNQQLNSLNTWVGKYCVEYSILYRLEDPYL